VNALDHQPEDSGQFKPDGKRNAPGRNLRRRHHEAVREGGARDLKPQARASPPPRTLSVGTDSIYGRYVTGRIDEVRVNASALTQARVQTDMATAVP
jgi:hypothetical protein